MRSYFERTGEKSENSLKEKSSDGQQEMKNQFVSIIFQLNHVELWNKELEQQLIQMTNFLEQQHQRHKQFIVLFLNERQLENQHHCEQLKQMSDDHFHENLQWQKKFEETRLENQRDKDESNIRIKQLQHQIDALIQEKNLKSPVHPLDQSKLNKSQTGRTEFSTGSAIVSNINDLSPPDSREKTPVSITRIQDTNSTRSVMSTPLSPRYNENSVTKMEVRATLISKRSSHSSSMFDLTSPATTPPRSHMVPVRPKSEHYRRSIPNTLHLSPSNTQDENSLLTKNVQLTVQSNKTIDETKQTQQTGFSPNNHIDDHRTLLKAIRAAVESRLNVNTDNIDTSFSTTNNSNESSINADTILIRAAETGNSVQLLKFLTCGANPNCQTADGNTCLHLSLANGHIECVRHLIKFGANPYLENKLGINAWNNMSRLNERLEVECLHEFVEQNQVIPPIDLILSAIERNHLETYNYLFTLLREQIKGNLSFISDLLRSALRCSNTNFLGSVLTLIVSSDLTRFIDENTYISTECLQYLENVQKKDGEKQPKPISLNAWVMSSSDEHHYSYAIGKISLTSNISWRELERLCVKVFMEHITQIDSPFDYGKSSIGFSATIIDTLTLGQRRWIYQDSPDENSSNPYVTAREQDSIRIHLKSFSNNSIDSFAYNYFIPSQHLKNFIRYIEQNPFVGVYGAAYLQKKSLFADLIRYLERPTLLSSTPKFRLIQFEIEIVTSLDDLIDEFVDQDFFHTKQSSLDRSESHHSTKILLYFTNIQNSSNYEILNVLMNSVKINDRTYTTSYTRDDDPNSTTTYYFSSNFHILITLSKRAWPTENEICKRFKWIPFKIDSQPWNGQLKRHLWRRLVHTNVLEDRPTDEELITTLQWITNVWQRYNECLQKLSLQEAALGPALFFDCPMERNGIFEWLQNKWNSIIAPLVREHSMNKCVQTKSKNSNNTITTLSSRNSLEVNAPYESTACTALYVLLQRAVSRDCPLTGIERDQYLMNFIGSRLEGSGSATGSFSSLHMSATSSRTGTPQSCGTSDFMSIQLE